MSRQPVQLENRTALCPIGIQRVAQHSQTSLEIRRELVVGAAHRRHPRRGPVAGDRRHGTPGELAAWRRETGTRLVACHNFVRVVKRPDAVPATMPLKLTVLLPRAAPKPLPPIVTAVPTGRTPGQPQGFTSVSGRGSWSDLEPTKGSERSIGIPLDHAASRLITQLCQVTDGHINCDPWLIFKTIDPPCRRALDLF